MGSDSSQTVIDRERENNLSSSERQNPTETRAKFLLPQLET